MDQDQVRSDLLRLQEPIITIGSDIDRSMYLRVRDSVAYLLSRGSPKLKVMVDSGGGDVAAGLDIYDLLRLYPGETTGLVVGRAASMATIVLQALNKRLCARHAGILIHHISRSSVSLDVLGSDKEVRKTLDVMRQQQSRLNDILVARTGKNISVIRAECRKDRMMSSEEALAFGLIDEIV